MSYVDQTFRSRPDRTAIVYGHQLQAINDALVSLEVHGQRYETTGVNGVNAVTWGAFTVTFPAGVFSAAPAVTVTAEVSNVADNRIWAHVVNGSVSTTGCSVRLVSTTGAAVTPTLDPVIDVIAVGV